MLSRSGKYIFQRSHRLGRATSSAKLERRDTRDPATESCPSGLIGGVGLRRLQPCQQIRTAQQHCKGAAISGLRSCQEYTGDDLERPARQPKLGPPQVDFELLNAAAP